MTQADLEKYFEQGEIIKKTVKKGRWTNVPTIPKISVSEKGRVRLNHPLIRTIQEHGGDLDNEIYVDFAVTTDYLVLKVIGTASETSTLIRVKKEGQSLRITGVANNQNVTDRLNKYRPINTKNGKKGALQLELRRQQTGPPIILMFRLP